MDHVRQSSPSCRPGSADFQAMGKPLVDAARDLKGPRRGGEDSGLRNLEEPNIGKHSRVVVVGVKRRRWSSLGPVTHLTPQHKVLLTEVGSVVVDINDRRQLGISEVGQIGEIYGPQRSELSGFTNAVASVTGPYIICSLQTAREFLGTCGRTRRSSFSRGVITLGSGLRKSESRLRSLSEVTIYDTERLFLEVAGVLAKHHQSGIGSWGLSPSSAC